MSRMVIRDLVIPVVQEIMQERLASQYRRPIIRDPHLEEFLEEEMRRYFGVIGANECQHLREQLQEAKKNDPYAFEFLIRELLEKYVRLAAKLGYAERLERLEEGPPDRFKELRERYPRRSLRH